MTMGIRKKISLGFFCLAIMLLFSGMISMFELNRMTHSTSSMLENSSHSMELGKVMLDAAQDQNTSLLQMIVLEQESYDSTFIAAQRLFEFSFAEAIEEAANPAELNEIRTAKEQYYSLVDSYMEHKEDVKIEWFVDVYRTTYFNLTAAIKQYMIASQQNLMEKASHLKSNAYRAITPGIITLLVAIIMIVMFSYLIDTYYTRPILSINKGLRNFINNKMPFTVKMEGRDDIFRLKENIEELISMYRNKKSE